MTVPRDVHRPRFGLLSLVVTGIGGGLLLVAYLFLDWFEGIDPGATPRRDGIETPTKLTLRDAYVASTESRLGALVHAYVSWLDWTLVLAVVLAALAASLPGARANQWRAVGVLAGLIGAIATYFACRLSFASDPDQRLSVSAHEGFGDTLVGAKLAFAGFLICAIGAALGPLGARTAEAGQRPHSPADAALTPRRLGSGAALVVGTLLLVLAFDHTSWYHTNRYDANPQIRFGDLIDGAGGRPVSRIAAAFFPTLAWVLLVMAIVVVVFANLRTALTPVLRVTGVVVGLSGVVLTYVALSRLFHVTYNPTATNGERSVFLGAGPGLWFAFAGFVLCAVAAAIAPRARGGPAAAPSASDTIGP